MERKEKMIEVIELANELSRKHGVYASVEFVAYGNYREGVEMCRASVIPPSRKCVNTVMADFATFEESLDFVIQFLKDAINVMEVRHAKH